MVESKFAQQALTATPSRATSSRTQIIENQEIGPAGIAVNRFTTSPMVFMTWSMSSGILIEPLILAIPNK